MQIIQDHSEKLLLGRVQFLKRKNLPWFAIYAHLSHLGADILNNSLQTLKNIVKNEMESSECWLYLTNSGDLIIIAQSAQGSHASTIASNICFMFAEHEIARRPITQTGNDFCRLYMKQEDLLEFHKTVIGLDADADRRRRAKIQEEIKKCTMDIGKFDIAARGRNQRRKPIILVVEDQKFSRNLVMEIIGVEFDTISAKDGFEAISLYEEFAPDIVFLDIDMPGMNGHQVLEKIISIDADHFVVMLTASQNASDVNYALAHKAQGYILKPFTRQKINQYIELFYKKHPNRVSTI